MGERNRVKGIRNITTFVVADALLAAVLLVWAQLWIQPSLQLWGKWYLPELAKMPDWFEPFNISVGIGLAWTYAAVFLALVALAWAVCHSLAGNDAIPRGAFVLFIGSLTMGGLNVLQSFGTTTCKLLTGHPVYETLFNLSGNFFYCFVCAAVVLGIIIVGLSMWCAYRKF